MRRDNTESDCEEIAEWDPEQQGTVRCVDDCLPADGWIRESSG